MRFRKTRLALLTGFLFVLYRLPGGYNSRPYRWAGKHWLTLTLENPSWRQTP